MQQVLNAAKIVSQKNSKVEFLLFGDGAEKDELILKSKEMNLQNVRFCPSEPRERMTEIQSLWDIALAPLKNIELF